MGHRNSGTARAPKGTCENCARTARATLRRTCKKLEVRRYRLVARVCGNTHTHSILLLPLPTCQKCVLSCVRHERRERVPPRQAHLNLAVATLHEKSPVRVQVRFDGSGNVWHERWVEPQSQPQRFGAATRTSERRKSSVTTLGQGMRHVRPRGGASQPVAATPSARWATEFAFTL